MVKTKMFFTMNAIVRFTRNSAVSETNAAWPHGSGREIFSLNSLISLEDQSIIIFNDNRAVWRGGGVVCARISTICTN